MEIGRLTPISARDAWLHEAQNFTPWLAEHLDELGEVLGIQMELQGREVAVETFSADILARNLFDDSLVLIENQLETTDHRHLGQILTYLAGLEAKTVVWLATDFREPHLSAVKWLNEHTADAFSFFAVRLRVVRIGDSPAAPIFDVLARPNLWERQLQAVARKSENMSEVGEYRKAFWQAYLDRYPGDASLGLVVTGASSNWVSVDESAQVIISAWVGKRMLGLFLRGPRGTGGNLLAEIIEPYRDALEQGLDAKYGRKTDNSFYGRVKTIDLDNNANWPLAIDWLHERIQQYLAVLRSTLPVSSS
ncbi:MAG: hypothetical protein LCH38_03205 [Proteobacteria bacterium]|nr:hypothetical protein [Pseudomonadota bacterium]